jgi:hypothetical protein
MKRALILVGTALIVIACSASFVGPATSNTGDPCGGHLNCGWACCPEANGDGAGWQCLPAGSHGPCEYTGGGIGPVDAKLRDAAADTPVSGVRDAASDH